MSEITSADVLAVLLPLWHAKPPPVQAVRQRIGTVMKWAIAKGFRPDSPAGDAISAALPKNGGPDHYRALPHGEVGSALARMSVSAGAPAPRLRHRVSRTHGGELGRSSRRTLERDRPRRRDVCGVDGTVHGFRTSFRNWAAMTDRPTPNYLLFTTQPSPPKGRPPMFAHFLGPPRVTANRIRCRQP